MSIESLQGYVFDSLGWISISLLVVLLFLLLRGPFRKYPLIVAYCVIQLLLTAAESYFFHDAAHKKIYGILYWTDEIVLNLMLFLMVIMFTYRAAGEGPFRAAMGKVLAAVCVIVLLVPLLLFKGPIFKAIPWFNHTSQLLSFCGAVLNLGLWSALAANRVRDPQLLTVSVGLGIAVTGAAIAYGVRGYLAKNWLWIPDMFMSATFVLCLALWCWAFRPRTVSG